jgi:hypothetical protein
MPEQNAPVVSEVEALIHQDNFACDLHSSEKYCSSSGSERSCSPAKSESSGCSESCDSVTDSDVSCCRSVDWKELDDCQVSNAEAALADLIKMHISDEELSNMASLGADVRHMFQSTWKLKSNKKAKQSSARVIPGQALRDMAQSQKDAMELHEKRKSVKPPPGFEQVYGAAPVTAESTQEPIVVAYADGNSTLTLSAEALCLHNITVAATVDSGHIFIKQMHNPTHSGLAPLEQDMMEAYSLDFPKLLRPIAIGSLLAVKSDGKMYRCQVTKFNQEADTCDIKFVDHGGYTTVEINDLCQLRQDFITLPFQAIEVYLAHVSPASDEIHIDIVSDILFRNECTIQMCGYNEDNIPVVQAFIYVNDYVHLLTQDIIDEAYTQFKKQFSDYTPVPVKPVVSYSNELVAESVISAEDAECAAYTPSEVSDEGICSGVSSTESEPRTAVHTPSCSPGAANTPTCDSLEPCVPVSPVPSGYSGDECIPPLVDAPLPVAYPVYGGEPLMTQAVLPSGEITYVPYQYLQVQDPNTGLVYLCPFLIQPVPVAEITPEAAIEEFAEENNTESQEVVEESNVGDNVEEKSAEEWTDWSKEEEEDYEGWTQEDYLKFYENQE